ncbi:mannose-P-dolichol utilization defect 1 protein homolog [Leptopilina heterotoma]|uniref:mannose-P-dolichol utilization defect 1 protein homolog n=1 Tax=Leptopilina heterotoma TaxID=63436 RepID=UPI001CA8949F|nr:mannose-P-dolichol utilization defect 1 protein homolog [Leptopilina heterotoma]
MAQVVRQAALFLLSDQCIKRYFDEYDFLHAECFKQTLSKGLGIAIILGSLLVKVPQIIKILNNKSAQGINAYSVILDLFAITAVISYSFANKFPFSAWGDGVFLGIQTLAIVMLVMYYNGQTAKASAFLAAYTAVIAAVFSNSVPLKVLWVGQTMVIPILLVSRFIQARTNYLNGSTGQLSAVTGFLLFFGSLARIFTSIQETGDASMIIMYICSTSANAVIVSQLLYYWNVVPKKSVESRKKKE